MSPENEPAVPPPPTPSLLERIFRVRERGSNVRTELLGGATTFAAMAYIIVVNPAILKDAGIPAGPSTVATILTAVFGTLLMAFYANRPLAVAPYMGENAFIAYGLAAAITWQMRLGTVFVSGLAFLVITVLHIRSWLANAISPSMKHSFAVGIGLFLAFLGLYETGIVTSHVTGMPPALLKLAPGTGTLLPPPVPVKIGDFHDPRVLLALGNFVLMITLMLWRVRGAILIAIAATGVLGCCLGQGEAPKALAAVPFTGEYALDDLAFQLDIAGVLRWSFLPILLTLFLMSFLDTLGTLIGVADAGGMVDDKGNIPDIEKPMLVDALSCVFSSLAGTSTSGAYIESATGMREGARTGLASLATALLFGIALFFIPLIAPLQHLKYAYAPALIAVGVLMLTSVSKIDFADLTEGVPAFATIVMMVFTFNIANGLTAGLALYPVLKVLAGRWRELHAGSLVLGAICLLYYLAGIIH